MTQLARLLLVEDNPHDVELFEIFILEEEGVTLEFESVDHAQALFDRLADSSQPKPDMILLDVNLPRVDGFEMLAKIRGEMGLRDLPVSMLSTSNDELDIARAYRAGANHYMTKPPCYNQLDHFVAKTPSLRWHKEGDERQLKRD